MYPEAIEHVIKEEENAKCYNSEFSEKPHCSFDLLEPGLLVSSSYFWIGASLNGIRKFHCCDPSVEEIKCPFKGRDLDPKIAFLLPTVGGKKEENGNFFSWQKSSTLFPSSDWHGNFRFKNLPFCYQHK